MADIAPFVFIVDTNQYSGNFEREMCAWMTGRVGECGVGGKESKIAQKEIPEEMSDLLDSYIKSMPGEHGCYRPCAIWQCSTPPRSYTSVAIFFEDEPPPEMILLLKDRAQSFTGCWRDLQILGFRLLKQELVQTEIPI